MGGRDRMQILIVDDDARMAHFYSHILARDGFSVRVAISLQEARSALNDSIPDILVLDRMLPDGDGNDLCRELKATPATASIFIILISGLKTTESEQIIGLDVGADDYLPKPFSNEMLLARVRAATRIKRMQEDMLAANAALRRSEDAFRALAEHIPDVVTRYDNTLRYLYVNSQTIELMDVAPERVIGRSNQELPLDQHLRDLWDAAVIEVFAKKGLSQPSRRSWKTATSYPVWL